MIETHLLEFPLSLILALAFVLTAVLCKNGPFGRFLLSRWTAAVLIVLSSVFLAIEGTASFGLFHHWTFLLLVLLTMLSLSATAILDWKKRSVTAFLSHLGFLLVLFGGFFGSPDITDVQMAVLKDAKAEHMAFDAKGRTCPLPFAVALRDFQIDYYEDGFSPKQFTSTLDIDGTVLKTSVNHSCRYRGYRIYQAGYDTSQGTVSVLKIVRDPWLPMVGVGALLLALSAILGLRRMGGGWKMTALTIVLAVVFTLVSVARIRFGTLMPALRSLWFVPHLIIYMLAYAIMALSVITGVISIYSEKIPRHLPLKLLSLASSLLLIGMLCGAVWAKQAWGDYWTWDAKENWAAVTWLLTLLGMHVPKRKWVLAIAITAFLAMQMTWYGVNYLPSSLQSLHTYNT